MALPLVWIVVTALAAPLVAKLEADGANEYAKQKKEQSEIKYNNASKQLKIAKDDTDTKLREIHDGMVNIYQDALQRSKTIFDFYETSLKDLPNVAIPEGYEVVENYNIPEVKLTTPFLSNFDIKKGMQGIAMVGGGYVAVGILDSVLHHATDLLKSQGMMMMSRSAYAVREDASNVRLAADKMEKEVDEFVKEVDGMQQFFSIAVAAANEAEAQMQKHLHFFERYLEPCKALLNTGKSFDNLSLDEVKNLEYLYRVLSGMKQFASNPFAVSV
jgi:hypothetical protein